MSPLTDTIAALSSPPGRSTRALIRLSGPRAHHLPILTFSSPARLTPAALRLSPALTLPVLTLRSAAPRSATGEDVLELLFPGNPALAARVLAAITAESGVRPAGPGEFSARAYLHGKLTLEQAEGLAATIAADSAADLAAARDLLTGAAGRRAAAWADELATLLALVEAGIDFTDQEDVVPIPPRDLAARLAALTDALRAHAGITNEPAHHARPRVLLVGPPNAGKSTLFNALLARRRAVVSETPGSTRDALDEPLDLSRDLPGAGEVTLTDLPGLDALIARTPTDLAAQSAARAALATADLILWCDPLGRPPPADLPAPVIAVRTKADRPAPASPALPVCALDGHNLPALRRRIAEHAFATRAPAVAALLPRHRAALGATVAALDAARLTVDPAIRTLPDPALTASALRTALDALGQITGSISPDDVLGRVFAAFCVGK